MYHTINQFQKGYQHKFKAIRNKKGELAMNKKEKAEIWKEQSDKLPNAEDPKELLYFSIDNTHVIYTKKV
jgi:hypothetical protein